jgi:hypothetical protein
MGYKRREDLTSLPATGDKLVHLENDGNVKMQVQGVNQVYIDPNAPGGPALRLLASGSAWESVDGIKKNAAGDPIVFASNGTTPLNGPAV